MRALKSLLGTALMRESRMLLGKRMDFVTIVGDFLAELKRRAELETGLTFERALSGRPVLFHSESARRNSQVEIDLRDCYLAAGFSDVAFMPEPDALRERFPNAKVHRGAAMGIVEGLALASESVFD